jgi:hypothetical protein
MNPTTTALLAAVSCAGLVILAIAAWYYLYRRPRDRKAPHRLGREMNLQLLNESGEKEPAWYGGRRRDHDFALTYANLRYGNYGPARSRTVEEVVLSLRLAVALNVAREQDIIAYFHHGRSYRPGELPEDFADGFDRRNTGRLSEESRQALLHFAQNFGGLRLRDRATAPPDLFAAQALPAAQVVLVHDRPGYKQTPQQVTILLDALLDVACILEKDQAFADRPSASVENADSA